MIQLNDHPIAAMFPLLPKDEIDEMAASIARNGQRRAIITYQGEILDGRNRYRACQVAGVEPKTEPYDSARHGSSVLQFVLDENLNRRHLSAGQRAMIAAQALTAMQAEAEALRKKREAAGQDTTPAPPAPAATTTAPKKFADGTIIEDDDEGPVVPSQAEMAHGAHVSERSMSSAMTVATDAEETAKVVAGEKSLTEAEKAVAKKKADEAARKERENKAIQEERAKILKKIRKNCGEVFAQAFLDGEILKTQKETAAFLALDDATQGKVAPYIATGWSVKKAASHVTRAITGSTTLDELINRAIAEKDGVLIFKHNGHEVAITKLSK